MKRNLLTIGAVVKFFLFSILFLCHMLVNEATDHHNHIRYAFEIWESGKIRSPHFLFQFLFLGTYALFPFAFASAALVIGACYAVMFVLIFLEAERLNPALEKNVIALLVIGTLFASHIFIFTLFEPNFYFNYLVPVSYHNPTQPLNKVFAIAIWILYWRQFLSSEAETKLSGVTLSVISILMMLSAIAKPSFLIAFLPIAGLVALAQLARGQFRRFTMAALTVAPACLVLLWQALFTYSGEKSRGIGFAPFSIFSDPFQYVATLPLSLALPIACLFFLRYASERALSFKLAWAYMTIALIYTLLLVELKDQGSGNFAWTAQTGAFILYVESLFLIVTCQKNRSRFPPLLMFLFIAHVFFGVVYATAAAFWPFKTWA
jgi:hypothetical protein